MLAGLCKELELKQDVLGIYSSLLKLYPPTDQNFISNWQTHMQIMENNKKL